MPDALGLVRHGTYARHYLLPWSLCKLQRHVSKAYSAPLSVAHSVSRKVPLKVPLGRLGCRCLHAHMRLRPRSTAQGCGVLWWKPTSSFQPSKHGTFEPCGYGARIAASHSTDTITLVPRRAQQLLSNMQS